MVPGCFPLPRMEAVGLSQRLSLEGGAFPSVSSASRVLGKAFSIIVWLILSQDSAGGRQPGRRPGAWLRPCVQGQACAGTGVSRGLPGQRSSWSCESAANPAKSEPAISIDSVAVHTHDAPASPRLPGDRRNRTDTGPREKATGPVVPRLPVEREASPPPAGTGGARSPNSPCVSQGLLRSTKKDRQKDGRQDGREGQRNRAGRGRESQRRPGRACLWCRGSL